MPKACIIGRGKWAQRLKKRFDAQGPEVDLLNPRADSIDVSNYEEVIICIPAYCVDEVLNRVNWGSEPKIVISCVKGLMANGETVCHYLDKKLANILQSPAQFLGGPNIDDGREIIEIGLNPQLELACVLKNVYAIGFGLALAQGQNFAAAELAGHLAEYQLLGITEKHWADLLVSCYSDKSRNKTFGLKFSANERYDERTIEGLNTARIIEKYNLFENLPRLRKITSTIAAGEK